MIIPHALRLLQCLAIAIQACALAACHGGGDSNSGQIQIKTLSNRADLISGGNAYVEIVLPEGKAIAGLTVSAGGRDATSSFAVRPNRPTPAVITGLAGGHNRVPAPYH